MNYWCVLPPNPDEFPCVFSLTHREMRNSSWSMSIFLCVLSNPRRNEKFPCVPCQFFCVFYLTLGDMRNFPVCHVNFPVFHLTHREMLNFPMGFDIFLCVLSKSTRKCAFPCVCMKKPSGKFGTHRDILVSSSRFHKKSEALV